MVRPFVVVCMYRKARQMSIEGGVEISKHETRTECGGQLGRGGAPVGCCVGLDGVAQLSSQRHSSCSLSTTLSLLHLCTSAPAVIRQRERKRFDRAGVDTQLANESQPSRPK